MTTMKKYALSLACLMMTAAASAANGHIWSIFPKEDANRVPIRGPVSSIDKPLQAGDKVSIIVRMASENAGQTAGKWFLQYIGPGSAATAWASNPLRIGIYVGGELREATLATDGEMPTGDECDYTDFRFEYTVKSGDFELPVVLAMADGSRATGDLQPDVAYYVNPLSLLYWDIRNEIAEPAPKGEMTAHFWYGSWPTTPEGAGDQIKDLDLRQAGYYVKTIDFDSNWETNDVWRSVHEGSAEVVGTQPQLTLPVPATNSAVLHVWSDNSDAVVVRGASSRTIVMKVKRDGSVLQTNTVVDVKVLGGATTVPFEIYGVASNKTANLILSSTTNYMFETGTSAMITNFVSVPVRCIERLPANVTATMDGGLEEVDVGSDYKTPVGTMTIKASTGYDGDLTVTITPRLRDGTLGWSNYVHLATSATAGKWATATPCTFTLTKAELASAVSAQKTIYIYAMGADTHTSLLDAGIVFDITVDTAAQTYYEKLICDSVLWFKPMAPVIEVPVEGAKLEANGNVSREFEFTVSDSYKNMNDRATGYKIYIKRENKEKSYTELAGSWGADENGVLYKIGSDGTLVNELPSITYYSSGTFETEVYLLAPDGKTKSAVRTFTMAVSEPASITPITDLNDSNTTNEGALATVYVKLSEKNSTGKTIYAFLRPVDEDSTNMVQSTCLTSTASSKGLKIGIGKDTSAYGTLLFLDGKPSQLGGSALEYELVLCYTSAYDPTQVVDGFQSENLTCTIFNVEPKLNEVRMNNVDNVTENGGTMTGFASKGVEKTFTFDVDEPGINDLFAEGDDRFQLRYSIKDGGATKTEILYGNPNTNSFKYAFKQPGLAQVSVELMDKDMKEYPGKFGQKFTFFVSVSEQPTISLESDSGEFTFDENRVGLRNSKMFVRLSENPSTDPLDLAITVTPADATSDNPGTLKLGGCTNQTGKANVYLIHLEAGQTEETIYIDEADGTKTSEAKGFVVQAKCITHTLNPDGKYWDEVFLAEKQQVLIQNVRPSLICDLGNPNGETNGFVTAVGNYETISWSVDDIALDLGDVGTITNLTVVWKSPGATLTTNVYASTLTNKFYFTPKFTEPGLKQVTVTVTGFNCDCFVRCAG